MRKILAAIALMISACASQPAAPTSPPSVSRLTLVEVKLVAPDKTYGGIAYVKITGLVHGQVGPGEAVVGLGSLPKNAAGAYDYASNFQLIVPAAGQPANEVIYIDSENRGAAISQGALGGFLQNHATSYGLVQWQTGLSAGVPENAQGIGLVIMRDFARWLAGRTPQTQVTGERLPPQAYRYLMLGGISQSAWFVNAFIAEGFNVDPLNQQRVFDAAIAVDGVGNWLAINNIAAARGVVVQKPYVDPNGKPLSRDELMTRSHTDPLYVDIANYTDFYRLRAGLTSVRGTGRKYRRYDFPSMHVAGRGLSNARCNNGERIQQNPLGYAPYMRGLVLGMEKEIGVAAARHAMGLPDSAVFKLGGEAPLSANFNPLPGITTPVPKVDVNGMPMGGVRFPESRFPLGRPEPVSLAPAITTSISETCGNSGGFKPFGRAALDARYGSMEIWLAHYDAVLDDRIKDGFLLEEDRNAMLDAAAELYALWP